MPNFTYTTNIPAASHNPSADQPIMQTNTNSIDSLIQVDHYSFNDNNGGYHKQVNLVNEANPGTPAGVGSVLFGKSNEWHFQNASLGVNSIQMTNSAAFPVAAAQGRSFLPGGIVIEWGNGTTGVGTGVLTQNFISAYTTIFCALATAASTGDAIANVAYNTTQMNVITKNNSGAIVSRPVSWMVIGIY